jgi:NhaP-type Na+/H+ or K+/H+ antiporter
MAYGSLISATDPVAIISAFKDYQTDPNFFQIIYGESILNDAVSIVFYDTCVNFYEGSLFKMILSGVMTFTLNIIGSTILGFAIGFLTAVFLKLISGRIKNIERIEISLMVILPWVSYLTAQMLGLSGIVSLLFNGIAHASYTKPNLTDWSKIVIKINF